MDIAVFAEVMAKALEHQVHGKHITPEEWVLVEDEVTRELKERYNDDGMGEI